MQKRRYIATVVMGVGALGALPEAEAFAAADAALGRPSVTQSRPSGHESPNRYPSRVQVAGGDDGGDDDGGRHQRDNGDNSDRGDGGDDDGGRRGHDGHDDDGHRKHHGDGDD